MDNPEEVMQILERFNVSRNPEITAQLEEYITFVARTGDSVYAWSLVKNLFREKLVNVISEFYNETPTKELPQYPNVDPFNYETMKKVLVERLESFSAAPFTIQRISELLSDPRKQYSRIDKFMRAVEKTILVVSTVPPGRHRSESENGDSLDSALNGDFAAEVNVDIDMEQDGYIEKDPPHAKPIKEDETTTVHDADSIEKKGSPKKNQPESPEKTFDSPTKDNLKEEPSKSPPKIESSSAALPIAIAIEESKLIESKSPTKDVKSDTLEVSPIVASVETIKTVSPVAQIAEIICEPVEPKVDDALLNEPIRSAENEILVDTSEIISETTPLAALENIVAIRTDPVIETLEQPTTEATTTKTIEPVAEQTLTVVQEESESEAKRLKLSEAPEIVSEKESPAVHVIEPEQAVLEASIHQTVTEKPAEVVETPAVQVEAALPSQEPAVSPIVEPTEAPVIIASEPIVEEKIDEPAIEIAEIPIEIVPSTVNIAEAPVAEMETVPTLAETNTMSLDEDEPPAIELEMTPIASKMDTDEAEAAPMDFEDDAEPMDQ